MRYRSQLPFTTDIVPKEEIRMVTMMLLFEGDVSPSKLAGVLPSRVRGVQVHVVSETHIEVHRGDDTLSLQVSDDTDELRDPDEMKEHGIDLDRVKGWVFGFEEVGVFREVLGVVAGQITKGWVEDDNGTVTPLAAYVKKIARAKSVEDL
jgi:hypothetical protein